MNSFVVLMGNDQCFWSFSNKEKSVFWNCVSNSFVTLYINLAQQDHLIILWHVKLETMSLSKQEEPWQ